MKRTERGAEKEGGRRSRRKTGKQNFELLHL
jgi:hypothetical protein